MQALLKDRIMWNDMRFIFDFGPIWSGKGGNQGVRTGEAEQHDVDYLHKKWGRYLNLQSQRSRYKNRLKYGISVKVNRHNLLV